MDARLVEAGRGWEWIVGGFNLFRKSPVLWIVLVVVLFLVAFVLGLVPFVGQLAFYLFSPVFIAGLMLGCRALEEGNELEIAHLFAGFQRHATSLITVGGVYLVGQIVVVGLMLAASGGAVNAVTRGADDGSMAGMMGGMLVAFAFGLAISIPLMMAVWFAPALIIFDGLAPVPALKASFGACLKNVAAFLVYGLILFVLAIVATIPFGLGVFVLVPTILGSIYVSYRDIFVQAQGAVVAP